MNFILIGFIYILLLVIISSIPIVVCIDWVEKKVKEIHQKQDKLRSNPYLSKKPYLFLICHGLQFLRGFVIPFITYRFFESDLLVLLSIIIIVACHRWCFFLRFQSQRYFLSTLLGVYGFLFWPLVIIFPILVAIYTLGFNSYDLGVLVSIFTLFFVFGFIDLPLLYLPINFFVFLVSFFSFGLRYIYPQENNQGLLIGLFESR